MVKLAFIIIILALFIFKLDFLFRAEKEQSSIAPPSITEQLEREENSCVHTFLNKKCNSIINIKTLYFLDVIHSCNNNVAVWKKQKQL